MGHSSKQPLQLSSLRAQHLLRGLALQVQRVVARAQLDILLHKLIQWHLTQQKCCAHRAAGGIGLAHGVLQALAKQGAAQHLGN